MEQRCVRKTQGSRGLTSPHEKAEGPAIALPKGGRLLVRDVPAWGGLNGLAEKNVPLGNPVNGWFGGGRARA